MVDLQSIDLKFGFSTDAWKVHWICDLNPCYFRIHSIEILIESRKYELFENCPYFEVQNQAVILLWIMDLHRYIWAGTLFQKLECTQSQPHMYEIVFNLDNMVWYVCSTLWRSKLFESCTHPCLAMQVHDPLQQSLFGLA